MADRIQERGPTVCEKVGGRTGTVLFGDGAAQGNGIPRRPRHESTVDNRRRRRRAGSGMVCGSGVLVCLVCLYCGWVVGHSEIRESGCRVVMVVQLLVQVTSQWWIVVG